VVGCGYRCGVWRVAVLQACSAVRPNSCGPGRVAWPNDAVQGSQWCWYRRGAWGHASESTFAPGNEAALEMADMPLDLAPRALPTVDAGGSSLPDVLDGDRCKDRDSTRDGTA
jgi:hypothetical protein